MVHGLERGLHSTLRPTISGTASKPHPSSSSPNLRQFIRLRYVVYRVRRTLPPREGQARVKRVHHHPAEPVVPEDPRCTEPHWTGT